GWENGARGGLEGAPRGEGHHHLTARLRFVSAIRLAAHRGGSVPRVLPGLGGVLAPGFPGGSRAAGEEGTHGAAEGQEPVADGAPSRLRRLLDHASRPATGVIGEGRNRGEAQDGERRPGECAVLLSHVDPPPVTVAGPTPVPGRQNRFLKKCLIRLNKFLAGLLMSPAKFFAPRDTRSAIPSKNPPGSMSLDAITPNVTSPAGRYELLTRLSRPATRPTSTGGVESPNRWVIAAMNGLATNALPGLGGWAPSRLNTPPRWPVVTSATPSPVTSAPCWRS